MTTRIHILWKGPLKYAEMKKLKGEEQVGLYQLYGTHLQYGVNVLLYIGQTLDDFSNRQKGYGYDHPWVDNGAAIRFYTGVVYEREGKQLPTLRNLLHVAERLLIAAHTPIDNAQGIKGIKQDESHKYDDYHVFNWGQYASLLPEVSGARHAWKEYLKISDSMVARE